ncbi:MAG: S8 family peptidase [Pseudomonadota bacterium]
MEMHTKSSVLGSLLWFPVPFLAIAIVSASDLANAQTTTEEKNSPGVYQIKAPALYALGHTGLNVTVAIVDTGIVNHVEFGSRVLPGWNTLNNSTNVTDGHGHGTHVSGIAGAGKDNPSTSGMFGVAYNAFLLPIKVLNDSGSGTSTSVAKGIQYAVDQRNSNLVAVALKPFAINLSLGSSSPFRNVEAALKNAVNAGMVVAAAAGNSGGANPIWPARHAKEAWANGQIVAVGAVDATNVIAPWSNRAGGELVPLVWTGWQQS